MLFDAAHMTTVLPQPRAAFHMQPCAGCWHRRKDHPDDRACARCSCNAMTRPAGPPTQAEWSAATRSLASLEVMFR